MSSEEAINNIVDLMEQRADNIDLIVELHETLNSEEFQSAMVLLGVTSPGSIIGNKVLQEVGEYVTTDENGKSILSLPVEELRDTSQNIRKNIESHRSPTTSEEQRAAIESEYKNNYNLQALNSEQARLQLEHAKAKALSEQLNSDHTENQQQWDDYWEEVRQGEERNLELESLLEEEGIDLSMESKLQAQEAERLKDLKNQMDSLLDPYKDENGEVDVEKMDEATFKSLLEQLRELNSSIEDNEEVDKPGEGEQPPGEGEKPPGEGEKPPGEGEKPPGEGEKPPGEGEKPPGEGEKPPGEGEKPPGEGEKPPGEGEKPPGEGEKPPGEGEEGGEGGGAGGPAGEGDGGSDNRIPRDPLVLDLDGDGVELTDLAASKAYFDLDGDGFATRTSWLNGDDAFLALDRNQDGTINNIAELFGSPERTGYEELSELDTNTDGVIDASDEQFADLKIWQDKNGDGVSQAAELSSLTDAGIASVSLSHTDVAAQQGSDGQIARQGTFTRVDGTQGTAAETTGIAADVLFASNPTFTKFVGNAEIDPEVLAVSNIKGYGQMPDLHIAMSLNSDFKASALALLASPSTDSLLANFEQLLTDWAGVNEISIDQIDPNHRLNVNTETGMVDFRLAKESFTLEQLGVIKQYAGMDTLSLGDGQWRVNGGIVTTGGYYREAYNELSRNLLVKVAVANGLLADVAPGITYDSETDLLSSNTAIDSSLFDSELSKIVAADGDQGVISKHWMAIAALVEISPVSMADLSLSINTLISNSDNVDALAPILQNALFELMQMDLYVGGAGTDVLAGDTKNNILIGFGGDDTIRGGGGDDHLTGGEGSDVLYGEQGDDLFDGGAGNDSLIGGAGNDTYLFGKGDGQDIIDRDDDRSATKRNVLRFKEGVTPDEVSAERVQDQGRDSLLLSIVGTTDTVLAQYFFNGSTVENRYSAIQQVEFSDGTIWSAEDLATKVLSGTEESDSLSGFVTDDTIEGLGGDDTIRGGGGDDHLTGGEGSDVLYGEQGDDLFDGGTGNDSLIGGAGNDTYLFGKGDGQDIIDRDDDRSATKRNVLRFKEGVTPDEVSAERVQDQGRDSLLLSIVGTTDTVLAQYFFNGSTVENRYSAIQQVEFSDGTIWSAEDLATKVLSGTEESDSLSGFVTDDTIEGLGGDDTIRGGGGDDHLTGGEGSDVLYGEQGDDLFDGGAGNDSLIGGAGNDTYLFGKGDGQDIIDRDDDRSATKRNVLRFKEGVTPDEVSAERVQDQGRDSLLLSIVGTTDTVLAQYFFNGSTVENRYSAIQQVEFSDGTIWSAEDLATKVLSGTEESDSLSGFVTDDTIEGLGGDDTIRGGGGDDHLTGGEGSDVLYGEQGDDLFDGGTGNDSLIGGAGNDTYLFGKGDGQDIIDRDDDRSATKRNVLRFKEGVTPDEVSAERVQDQGRDSLLLSIVGTTDTVLAQYFFNGSTVENRYSAIQQVEFSDGTIWSAEDLATKVLSGTEESDSLSGFVTDDTIEGLGGDDTIRGGGGDDHLTGGEGSDVLYGEQGDDLFDGGAGNDSLIGGAGNDTYLFGKGDGQDIIDRDDDRSATKRNVLRFKEGVTPDEVSAERVQDQGRDSLLLSIVGTTDTVLAQYFFNGSTVENRYSAIQQVEFSDGTIWSAEDLATKVLSGTEESDSLSGFVTGDTIEGLGGDDTIRGGGGDDHLTGGEGSDVLYGEQGDDLFDGGAGNDSLIGGAGNDTYLFGKGDGQDIIDRDDDRSATKRNVLRFKEGVTPDEVSAERVQDQGRDSLLLSIVGTTDTVLAQYFFNGSTVENRYSAIQQVEFSDGTIWSAEDLATKVLSGTEESDSLSGFVTDDTIEGLGGDDTIRGGGGDDHLTGGEGSDVLYGEQGDDLFDGGTGNDSLIGGAGNDTYLFGKGDGQDIIDRDDDRSATKRNVLRFKEGVTPDEVSAERVQDQGRDSLLLSIVGTTDTVLAQYFFNGSTVENRYSAIQQVEFSDGTIWSAEDLATKVLSGTEESDSLSGFVTDDTIEGLGGDDTIRGGGGDDHLTGGEGSDVLYGEQGDDLFDGGAGNDSLIGGAGNDTYLFGKGDGQDIIDRDDDRSATKRNVLRFKEGVTPDEVSAERVQDQGRDSLLLSIVGTTDTVLAQYFFNGSTVENRYSAIQQVEFSDGTIWSAEDLATKVLSGTEESDSLSGFVTDDTIEGLGGDDTIRGGGGDDHLTGGEGSDVLYGEQGDDLFDGGAGNDSLIGGAGNDTYLFGKGDGQDIIDRDDDRSATKRNVLRFKEGVTPDEVSAERVQDQGRDSLLLSIVGTTDTVLAQYFFNGSTVENRYSAIQQVEFSDGTIWSAEDLAAKALLGTEGSDAMIGLIGDDTLEGFGGDDTISGGSGNDVLLGGAGNDVLKGEGGSDTYQFDSGSGSDTVNNSDADTSSVDIARFTDASLENLWFSRSGNDLNVTVAGTDDQVQVSNWYGNANNQLDRIEAGGAVLLNNQVDQLVSAMASFDVPSGAGSVIPQDVKDELQPVLAETWQPA